MPQLTFDLSRARGLAHFCLRITNVELSLSQWRILNKTETKDHTVNTTTVVNKTETKDHTVNTTTVVECIYMNTKGKLSDCAVVEPVECILLSN